MSPAPDDDEVGVLRRRGERGSCLNFAAWMIDCRTYSPGRARFRERPASPVSLGIAPDARILNVKVANARGVTDVSQVLAALKDRNDLDTAEVKRFLTV